MAGAGYEGPLWRVKKCDKQTHTQKNEYTGPSYVMLCLRYQEDMVKMLVKLIFVGITFVQPLCLI